MSSAPTDPPGSLPPIPPYWTEELDWIVLVTFLPRQRPDALARATEGIGHMLAYSQMTDTRMLALLGDPHGDAYELLFSFSSPKNKAEFFHLLQSNRKTTFEDEEILVPTRREIEAAQPIALVLPEDVMRQVTIIATNLFCGQNETIQ
jgi:hypothetical protein